MHRQVVQNIPRAGLAHAAAPAAHRSRRVEPPTAAEQLRLSSGSTSGLIPRPRPGRFLHGRRLDPAADARCTRSNGPTASSRTLRHHARGSPCTLRGPQAIQLPQRLHRAFGRQKMRMAQVHHRRLGARAIDHARGHFRWENAGRNGLTPRTRSVLGGVFDDLQPGAGRSTTCRHSCLTTTASASDAPHASYSLGRPHAPFRGVIRQAQRHPGMPRLAAALFPLRRRWLRGHAGCLPKPSLAGGLWLLWLSWFNRASSSATRAVKIATCWRNSVWPVCQTSITCTTASGPAA